MQIEITFPNRFAMRGGNRQQPELIIDDLISLLLLNRLQVRCDVLQANLPIIPVPLDLVEEGSPDRHFSRAVGDDQFVACDLAANNLHREGAAISSGD